MAGKRINDTAPLTAAEKQKRHREKKAAAVKQTEDQQLEKLREFFISEIYKLSYNELLALMRKAYSRSSEPDRVTIKELSALSGVSVYELNKLTDQGVIKPIDDNDLSDIEPGLAMLGLTEDEFRRFIHYLDQPMTLKELSTSANIPMHKLERMDKMGVFHTA